MHGNHISNPATGTRSRMVWTIWPVFRMWMSKWPNPKSILCRRFTVRSSCAGLCTISAIKFNGTKEFLPFLHDLCTPCFNDTHNIMQYVVWDTRLIMAQQALPSLSNPNFRCVFNWFAFMHVHMNGLQRNTFTGPKINPIRADLKNLRHVQIRLPARIPVSSVP